MKKKQTKSRVVIVRVTPKQYKDLKKEARYWTVKPTSVAAYIRYAVFG